MARCLILILPILFCFDGFAKSQNKTAIHQMNKKIARAMNFKNPRGIMKLMRGLSNSRDRTLFKRLMASKKGKKIETQFLMDQFMISENGKVTVIQTIRLKPLTIRVNEKKIYVIDGKNISRSFSKKKKNKRKKSKSAWNLMINEAHAFFGGGDDSNEWAFVYSSIKEAGINMHLFGGFAVGVSEEGFTEDVAKFMNDNEIELVKCDHSKTFSQHGGFSFRGVSLRKKDGEDLGLTRDGVVVPLKSGNSAYEFDNFLVQQMQHEQTANAAFEEIAKGYVSRPDLLDLNTDFHLDCSSVTWTPMVKRASTAMCGWNPTDAALDKFTPSDIEALQKKRQYYYTGAERKAAFEALAQLKEGEARLERMEASIQDPVPRHVFKALTHCCEIAACRQAAQQGPEVRFTNPGSQGTSQ